MSLPAPTLTPARGLVAIVGFLVFVEFASGILQGYYTPIFSDIADHLGISDADVNWFEAAQLIVSALAVPPLARLGDLAGHKAVLLCATAATAAGSWVMAFAPGFTTFLVGVALQGAYVVWLPLEVAIVYRRTSGNPRQHQLTRRSAAILVGALQLSVIVGALTSGALVGSVSMTTLLMLPAIAVTACFVVIWFGIEDVPGTAGRASLAAMDLRGLALLTAGLGLVMAGLIAVRLQGPGSPLPWLLLLAGAATMVVFVRAELAIEEPLVDVRLLASSGQWQVQLCAFLFGMSVLGAQIPLSTFARTDPDVVGYGLGASAAFVSTLVGVYVIFMAVGAFSLPLTSRLFGERGALVVSAVLAGTGYALWLPLHGSTGQALVNMMVIGVGSGALVAALPAVAAAAAPPERTGFATGMTNGIKTVGGAIASAVFAIALSATGSLDAAGEGHAPLAGYLTVWAVCAVSAYAAAVALAFLPRRTAQAGSDVLSHA
ncbi:MFS transporter [Nocardioides sp. GY 10113]|uniref:MFS transporter n=1 Tax=Nocardioides sp. GY 10113 TaxID=2569761 RepID=UPI0010A76BBC|nr:MFS transporter [Nocardioides sp. GY 10113]TIC88967.1 MFS transporter [Nocardioides sp. GY 10113]